MAKLFFRFLSAVALQDLALIQDNPRKMHALEYAHTNL